MQYTVTCPLTGFEQVSVTYNLGVSTETYNEFMNSLGSRKREDVIAKIDGWDEEAHGEPFGETAPMGWRAWVCQKGAVDAIRGFGSRPN